MKAALAVLGAVVTVAGCTAIFDGSDLHGTGGRGDGGVGDDLAAGQDGDGGDGSVGGDGGGPGGVTFAPAQKFAFGGSSARAYGLAIADFNGDGKPDIAVANGGENLLGILLGDGQGAFSATSATYPACALPASNSPDGIVVGDFNHDNKPDVAVGCDPSASTDGALDIFLNTTSAVGGDPTFSHVEKSSLAFSILAVRTGDFDHDGNLDLVTLDRDVPPGVANPAVSYLSVFFGSTSGAFSPPVHYPTGHGSHPADITVGDFNGDGTGDVAALFDSDEVLTIFYGGGATRPTLFGTPQDSTAGTGVQQLVAAALHDVHLDDLLISIFVFSTSASQLQADLNRNRPPMPYAVDGGVFLPQPPLTTELAPLALATGDFDHDGKRDVAVGCFIDANSATSNSSSIDVFLGNGQGGFGPRIGAGPVVVPPHYLAVGDFNGDHFDDVVVAASSGGLDATRVYVVLNTTH